MERYIPYLPAEPPISDCAHLAIECHDPRIPCNVAWVAHLLAVTVMPGILAEMRKRGKSMQWANEHPVVYLFVYKLLLLNQCIGCTHTDETFSKNYELVELLKNPAVRSEEIY